MYYLGVMEDVGSIFYDSTGAEESKCIPPAFLKMFHLHVILHWRV